MIEPPLQGSKKSQELKLALYKKFFNALSDEEKQKWDDKSLKIKKLLKEKEWKSDGNKTAFTKNDLTEIDWNNT